MTRLIVTRLATLIPLMLITTSIVFFLVRFVPGDPVRIMVGGQRISPQNVESIRHQYRLDKPLLVQYGYWLDDLAHGSLGDSFRQRAHVRDLVMDRLPITLKLAAYQFSHLDDHLHPAGDHRRAQTQFLGRCRRVVFQSDRRILAGLLYLDPADPDLCATN